ncbi:MAG: DUF2326 domain-containing protein [Prosthecobacter sp.]
MKLSKLYTNKPEIFSPISFESGLNVVLAEIRLPENKDKDTHNLGKTTVGRLLDFCFLSGRDPNFFLFKHEDIFKDFVFFLEIELNSGSYLTLRRGVEEASLISFKRHSASKQDFSELPEKSWDHFNVPFERSKDLLDGMLDWRTLKPWSFRHILGYLLRSQADYGEVFQLRKFASQHIHWKPFLAHILGFDGSLLKQHYQKEEELSKKEGEADIIQNELRGSVEDISKIEGFLLLKKNEVQKKTALLAAFDFRSQDKEKTKQLVDVFDSDIAELNGRRYTLTQNKKKILASLEDGQILFNPDEAKRLFEEAGILFQGQIKNDFEQLIEFNKSITEERASYLREELIEIENALKQTNAALSAIGKKRSEALSFLSTTDIFDKYKRVSDELVTLRADIISLERQRDSLHRLQELRAAIRVLKEEKVHLQAKVEENKNQQDADASSFFSSIRLYFSEIVEDVISRQALLSVAVNKEGHLDFRAEILDESGNATSADSGNTYRKLLCIAFDLAILRAHGGNLFPCFVFHDGVFESLDDRKKENLLYVLRKYADLNVQPVITLIDSDVPARPKEEGPFFRQNEVILTLHDEGEDGRLFQMRSW